MLFRIEITHSAETDIDDAYLWIYEQSSTYAEKWIRGLITAVHSLKELPARCPIAAESRDLDREIRQLIYGRGRHGYRILYEVRGETVVVLRVRHTARDYLDPGAFEPDPK